MALTVERSVIGVIVSTDGLEGYIRHVNVVQHHGAGRRVNRRGCGCEVNHVDVATNLIYAVLVLLGDEPLHLVQHGGVQSLLSVVRSVHIGSPDVVVGFLQSGLLIIRDDTLLYEASKLRSQVLEQVGHANHRDVGLLAVVDFLEGSRDLLDNLVLCGIVSSSLSLLCQLGQLGLQLLTEVRIDLIISTADSVGIVVKDGVDTCHLAFEYQVQSVGYGSLFHLAQIGQLRVGKACPVMRLMAVAVLDTHSEHTVGHVGHDVVLGTSGLGSDSHGELSVRHVTDEVLLLVLQLIVGHLASDVGGLAIYSFSYGDVSLLGCHDVVHIAVGIDGCRIVLRPCVDLTAGTGSCRHLEQIETILQSGDSLVHVERSRRPALGTGVRTVGEGVRGMTTAHGAFPARLEVFLELRVHEQVGDFTAGSVAHLHSLFVESVQEGQLGGDLLLRKDMIIEHEEVCTIGIVLVGLILTIEVALQEVASLTLEGLILLEAGANLVGTCYIFIVRARARVDDLLVLAHGVPSLSQFAHALDGVERLDERTVVLDEFFLCIEVFLVEISVLGILDGLAQVLEAALVVHRTIDSVVEVNHTVGRIRLGMEVVVARINCLVPDGIHPLVAVQLIGQLAVEHLLLGEAVYLRTVDTVVVLALLGGTTEEVHVVTRGGLHGAG